ncbi:MAG: zinc-ribbon domain containing protein [Candidatus Abawacabacteria bacterium]|nr:zinc-ribbon domain containing protein [Candidatus Abawacabacteria bacterium]
MNQNCTQCHNSFLISDHDSAFYQKVSPEIKGSKYIVQNPQLCPDCRQKRRLRFRNERHLYARHCDLCQKDIIALYPQSTSFPVYCPNCWWSDNWDATQYGLAFSPQSEVFSQIKTLFHTVPRISLINIESENSTYAHDASHNKNCYLVFSAAHCQDSLYLTDCGFIRNSLDCYWCLDCELCYEGISLTKCYQTFFSIHCHNLNFSYFCFDCHNCNYCFGCFNLNNKEYYIFNQPYTKEAYLQKLAQYQKQLSTWSGNQLLCNEVKIFWHKQPHKYANTNIIDNCTGDFLVNCKNCQDCFNVVNSQDCKYLYDNHTLKDSYDCNISGQSDLLYNCQSCWGFMNICCSFSAHCSNLYYSDSCFYCENCFGCVGLNHKKYCIFNKQYTKEDFDRLAPQLIQLLVDKNAWGEFFPSEIAPIEESDSVLQYYFPPTDEIPIDEIVGHSSLESILTHEQSCRACSKKYLIIKQEEDFYYQHQLPFPPLCPTCRHKRRMQQKNPRKLYSRHCQQCQQAVSSSYPDIDPRVIYCEQCYAQSAL